MRCHAIYRSDFIRCPTDGAEIGEVEGDPLVGMTIGEHYVIDACIGEGAMGRVYRAHHERLERKQFAVKVLLGDLASTLTMRLRFAQEAEATSRLDHPNVVSVVDYGKSQSGLLYLVMDYVEGATLSQIIAADGAMAPDRTVAIVRGMCRGLAHAHERGLVHRDFKPDNVIVQRIEGHDVPRILDFGLAIVAGPAEDQARLTSVGVAMGTPVYAAPEQTSGNVVDHRADLFALGITLYEMLAGVTPFAGNIAEVIYLNATADVPAIAERAPGAKVSPALERIVRKLAHRDPEQRFGSAREVLEALDRVEAGGRAEARHDTEPPPNAPSMPVPVATTPAARTLGTRPIAIGLVVLAVAAVVMVLWPRESGTDPVSASTLRDDAQTPMDVEVDATSPAIVVAVTDASPATEPPQDDATTMVDEGRDRGPRAAGGSAAAREPRSERPPPPPAIDAGVNELIVTPEPRPIDAGLTTQPTPPPRTIDAGTAQPPVVGAHVGIAKIDLRGSLSVSEVRRSIERALPGISTCYRRAATRAGRSPTGTSHVTLTIDETGEARAVRASGGPLPGLDACIAAALGGVRTRSAPDVGTVSVTLDLSLQPEEP